MNDPKPRRRGGYLGLILPFALVLLALGGWTVWWFVVANQVETRMDKSVQDLGRAGYQVAWHDRTVSGWPFRTDVEFTDLRITAPGGSMVSAPELGAEANTYALGKWVIIAPKGLVVTRGAKGATRIDGLAIRASISGADHTPPNLAIEMRQPTFTPLAGAEPMALASAQTIDFYLRPKVGAEGVGEFLFRVEGGHARPGGALEKIVGGQAFLMRWEGTLEHLDKVRFHSWSKTIETWTRAGGDITGNHAEFVAGNAAIEMSSPALTLSSDGHLSGDVDVDLSRSGPILATLGAAAQVGQSLQGLGAAAPALQAVAAKGHLTVTFDGKDARFAGYRLAPAPKIF